MTRTIIIIAGFSIILLFVPSLLPVAGLLLFAVLFVGIVWGFFVGIPAFLSRSITNKTLRALVFVLLIIALGLIVSALQPVFTPLMQSFFTSLTCMMGPVSDSCLR